MNSVVLRTFAGGTCNTATICSHIMSSSASMLNVAPMFQIQPLSSYPKMTKIAERSTADLGMSCPARVWTGPAIRFGCHGGLAVSGGARVLLGSALAMPHAVAIVAECHARLSERLDRGFQLISFCQDFAYSSFRIRFSVDTKLRAMLKL